MSDDPSAVNNSARAMMAAVPKFRTEKAIGPRGFSRWVQPRMSKYLLACCDCGLVHEAQFRIVTGPVRDGGQVANVQFRMRRAEGHTRRLRKKET